MDKYVIIVLIAFIFLYASGVSYAVYTLPSDRTITWQGNVGVSQRSGIPARSTICGTANAATYGNGGINATSHIQGLINACPNNETVYIPAGTYRLNSMISIPNGKSITLRGAGQGTTILQGAGSGAAVIQLGNYAPSFGQFSNPNYCPQTNAPAGYVQNITAGLTKNSTTITLSSASSMAVGDLGIINVLSNNNSSVDLWTQSTNIGEEGSSSIYGFCCASASTCRSLGQVVEITAKNGNTITVAPPLYTDYSGMYSPQFSRIAAADVVKNVGIEDLTIDNIAGTGGTTALIFVLASKNVWIKNVELSRANGRFVWVKFVNLFTEVRDSYFHDSLTTISNNYGIDTEQWGSAFLYENNVFNNTMVPVQLGTGASGGVAAYNYIRYVPYDNPNTWMMASIMQHAASAWMNLAEGNIAGKLLLDNIHGTEFYFTAFRNHFRYDGAPVDYAKTDNVNMEIQRGARLHNVVGNILGYTGWSYPYQYNGTDCGSSSGNAIYKLGYNGTGCSTSLWDSKTEATLLRHANFDYANNAVVWNGSDDHMLPNSLYLSSKPSWWGSLIWPSIGPDVQGYFTSIPAKDRFLNGSTPPPIQNFSPNQIIEAESGQLTTMQTGTSGSDTYIYTNTNDIGSAKYTFDITISGQYKMEAKVNSNNDAGQNSFYVGLDNESAQNNILYSYNIFPLATGFVWDEVSKWGNGQTGNPPISEFDPMTWNLNQGTYSFTFYGRESNTWLDQIRLVPVTTDITPPSAPTGLIVN